jgi:hypothetical protein
MRLDLLWDSRRYQLVAPWALQSEAPVAQSSVADLVALLLADSVVQSEYPSVAELAGLLEDRWVEKLVVSSMDQSGALWLLV